MKNILILSVILFAASFSFVGCSDDPVDSITGPTPFAGPQGDTGATGPEGDPGIDGTDAVSDLLDLNSDEHVDIGYDFYGRSYDPDGIRNVLVVCTNGYHIVPGSQSNICRDSDGYDEAGYNLARPPVDRNNYMKDGCQEGKEYWDDSIVSCVLINVGSLRNPTKWPNNVPWDEL